MQPHKVIIRQPKISDGLAVHLLVKNSPPLDLNSPYFYLVQSSHFASTCAVAEMDGKIVGWVSGHIKPEEPTTYFLWQVAISEELRGRGMALKLIKQILTRPHCHAVTHLETTITPSNQSSWTLFTTLSENLKTPLKRRVMFSATQLGGEEDELLVRIGPFQLSPL